MKPETVEIIKREALAWSRELLIALILFFIIHTLFFTMVRVDGASMESTLRDSDRIASTIIDVKLNGPKRLDVVICHYPNREPWFVKRVIGLPGETIAIRGGITYINGEALIEPYIKEAPRVRLDMAEKAIPEGHYFVMGDNRNNSTDSRDPRVGMIARSEIHAKARLRLWPLDRLGMVD